MELPFKVSPRWWWCGVRTAVLAINSHYAPGSISLITIPDFVYPAAIGERVETAKLNAINNDDDEDYTGRCLALDYHRSCHFVCLCFRYSCRNVNKHC